MGEVQRTRVQAFRGAVRVAAAKVHAAALESAGTPLKYPAPPTWISDASGEGYAIRYRAQDEWAAAFGAKLPQVAAKGCMDTSTRRKDSKLRSRRLQVLTLSWGNWVCLPVETRNKSSPVVPPATVRRGAKRPHPEQDRGAGHMDRLNVDVVQAGPPMEYVPGLAVATIVRGVCCSRACSCVCRCELVDLPSAPVSQVGGTDTSTADGMDMSIPSSGGPVDSLQSDGQVHVLSVTDTVAAAGMGTDIPSSGGSVNAMQIDGQVHVLSGCVRLCAVGCMVVCVLTGWACLCVC